MDDFTVIICDFEVIPEQNFTICNSHSVYKIGHGRLLVWRYFVLPTNCALVDPLLISLQTLYSRYELSLKSSVEFEIK